MFGRKRTKPIDLASLDDLKPLIDEGKPILLDFFQTGCAPCRVMDGIVNELAEEYEGGAHIVKVNVGKVPGAVEAFKIRSTPTFVLLSRAQKKASKKARKRAGDSPPKERSVSPRWRASGLVRKDQMERVLQANGGVRTAS